MTYNKTNFATTFSTLYARAGNKEIKEWYIEVVNRTLANNTKKESHIIIRHGLTEGKKQEESIFIEKGKNIGKSNETTPYEQAISEAESRWNHKKREGYKTLEEVGIEVQPNGYTIGNLYYSSKVDALNVALPEYNTDADNNLKPMKCQPYLNKKGKVVIKFPCFGQPKLNGFRCVARLEMEHDGMFDNLVVKFRSKNGLEYKLDHIANEFRPEYFGIKRQTSIHSTESTELVFDGEMYIHGAKLQEISSAVRKYNENTPRLEFRIFDLAIDKVPQTMRFQYLNFVEGLLVADSISTIKVVPHKVINSDAEAQAYTDACIAEGYEGAVFRDMKALYAFGKRPSTITKLKRFEDAEFEILDIILPEDGNASYSVLLCKNDTNEETFKVAIEGDMTYRSILYQNKSEYIGKRATVRYYERTADNIPFHAVCTQINRPDE